ncbi:hypothetical protein ACQP2H_23650 [Micromonospora sp. CA-248260]|uniref:hypothetical protein n=1 Tax=Micromonospora sp. CA-248260 TaxID=3239962 RepID=UPI003D8E4E28
MNVLSQIIPGVREARTPLAIGVIWSIIAWIACSLAPKEVWQKDVFAGAASQIGKIPTEALIGIAALIVYLVGIFLQSVGEAVSKLAIPTILAGSAIVLFIALIPAIMELALTCITVCAILLFAVAGLRHHRIKSGTYWTTVEDTLTAAWQNLINYIEHSWLSYRNSRETRHSIFNEICADSLEDYYASNPGFLEEKVKELTHSSLHQAALGTNLTLEEAYAEGNHKEVIPAHLKTLADLRLHLANAEEYDNGIRIALIKKLKRDRQARVGLTQVLDLSAYQDWLIRRLDRVDHELRSTRPELYLEYDRIRSEGEFRRGISFPLGALIAIICYKWHLTFNALGPKALLWGPLIGSVAVWLVVHSAGTSQTDRAARMLYAAVRDKTIELPDETPFGEPIFVFRPLPEVRRPATVTFVAKNRLQKLLRRPLQRIFPELAEREPLTATHHNDQILSGDLELGSTPVHVSPPPGEAASDRQA